MSKRLVKWSTYVVLFCFLMTSVFMFAYGQEVEVAEEGLLVGEEAEVPIVLSREAKIAEKIGKTEEEFLVVLSDIKESLSADVLKSMEEFFRQDTEIIPDVIVLEQWGDFLYDFYGKTLMQMPFDPVTLPTGVTLGTKEEKEVIIEYINPYIVSVINESVSELGIGLFSPKMVEKAMYLNDYKDLKNVVLDDVVLPLEGNLKVISVGSKVGVGLNPEYIAILESIKTENGFYTLIEDQNIGVDVDVEEEGIIEIVDPVEPLEVISGPTGGMNVGDIITGEGMTQELEDYLVTSGLTKGTPLEGLVELQEGGKGVVNEPADPEVINEPLIVVDTSMVDMSAYVFSVMQNILPVGVPLELVDGGLKEVNSLSYYLNPKTSQFFERHGYEYVETADKTDKNALVVTEVGGTRYIVPFEFTEFVTLEGVDIYLGSKIDIYNFLKGTGGIVSTDNMEVVLGDLEVDGKIDVRIGNNQPFNIFYPVKGLPYEKIANGLVNNTLGLNKEAEQQLIKLVDTEAGLQGKTEYWQHVKQEYGLATSLNIVGILVLVLGVVVVGGVVFFIVKKVVGGRKGKEKEPVEGVIASGGGLLGSKKKEQSNVVKTEDLFDESDFFDEEDEEDIEEDSSGDYDFDSDDMFEEAEEEVEEETLDVLLEEEGEEVGSKVRRNEDDEFDF